MNYISKKSLIISLVVISGCVNPKHHLLEKISYDCFVEDELTESYLRSEKEFDYAGNLIQEINYNEDNTIYQTETYNYNKANKVVLYSSKGPNDNIQNKYLYNEVDSLIKEIHINNNSIHYIDSIVYKNGLKAEVWRIEYMEYNTYAFNTILETKSTDPNKEKFFQYKAYNYDLNSRLVYEYINTFNTNGPFPFWKYEYDANNNKIKEEYFNYNDNGIYSCFLYIKTYDNSNNLIDFIAFNMYKSVLFHFKYDYNIKNELIREECIERDPYVITHEYYRKGKLKTNIELNRNDATGKMWKHVYKYKYQKKSS